MTTRITTASLVLAGLTACQSTATGPPSPAPQPPAAAVAVERIDLTLGNAARQTVLAGTLLGRRTADLAVVDVGADQVRHLTVYSLAAGAWTPRRTTTLPAGTRFVDVVRIAGRDRLLTYRPGRLGWFDPTTGHDHRLAALTTSFVPPRADEIQHVDLTHDLNADGRDDLAVPTDRGFLILTQGRDGSFAAPVSVGQPADLRRITGADGYRYNPLTESRIHRVDIDRDGRQDLVAWDSDHFDVHRQGSAGRFATRPQTLTTTVPFDADHPAFFTDGDQTGRVLVAVDDIDGDGLADLVVHSLGGKRITRKHSAYHVHRGTLSGAGTLTFAPEPALTFHSPGRIQFGFARQDIDGDGRRDVVVTSIGRDRLHGSPWKSLKGMMGDDIGYHLELYRNTAGTYPNKPTSTLSVGLDGAPSHREPGHVPPGVILRGPYHEARRTQKIWPRAFNPTWFLDDLTGDGRADFLVERSFRGLDLIAGQAAAPGFATRPQVLRFTVPQDSEYVWLHDLDRDGRRDLILHHPTIKRDIHGGSIHPQGTENQQLTTILLR